MPKPKRVFIAINLPEETKESLFSLGEKKYPNLPCKWVKKEDLHMTLAFLGNTGQKELEKVKRKVEQISKEENNFEIRTRSVQYGPPGRKIPSLVWILTEKEKPLLRIKKRVDETLEKHTSYKPRSIKYLPHITLGRIRKMKWRRMDIEERPTIKERVNVNFPARSIDIMESKLKRSGPEYILLKSSRLQDEK